MWRKLNSGDEIAYNEWVTNFGRSDVGAGGSDSPSVPEPAAMFSLLIGICMVARRRVKLTAWTRRP
jgi:hypothetical protein